MLKQADCSCDYKLVNLTKCEVQVHGDRTGVFVNGFFTTNITSFSLEAALFTKRQKRLQPLINMTDLNVCHIIDNGKSSAPIVRLIRDMLDSGGNMPKKCPVPDGYEFGFHDLNVDPRFFPFLPEMHFLLFMSFGLNRIPGNFVFNITGEVVGSSRKSAVISG